MTRDQALDRLVRDHSILFTKKKAAHKEEEDDEEEGHDEDAGASDADMESAEERAVQLQVANRERCKNVLRYSILPHLGQNERSSTVQQKCVFLCYMWVRLQLVHTSGTWGHAAPIAPCIHPLLTIGVTHDAWQNAPLNVGACCPFPCHFVFF